VCGTVTEQFAGVNVSELLVATPTGTTGSVALLSGSSSTLYSRCDPADSELPKLLPLMMTSCRPAVSAPCAPTPWKNEMDGGAYDVEFHRFDC
jgi:hypothetical protein